MEEQSFIVGFYRTHGLHPDKVVGTVQAPESTVRLNFNGMSGLWQAMIRLHDISTSQTRYNTMSLKQYGVLVGKATAGKREDGEDTPHYQVKVRSAGVDYRLAVNVKSKGDKPELLYLVADPFEHPILNRLAGLAEGFTLVPSQAGGVALDFVRGNLFDKDGMRTLPHNLPGPSNDLNDRIEHLVARAISEQDAQVFAFGERWGPEQDLKDKIFGFKPGNGVHDIHMNQGNDAAYRKDDGVWQDGGLLFHFPSTRQWVGVFLAFQSQSWHTDDQTGHTIEEDDDQITDKQVRIIAAMVNPAGPDPEVETVLLLNPSPQAIDLSGWQIADQQKRKCPLSGRLPAHGTISVQLGAGVKLGNSGGLITLLDNTGIKVHGVSYTKIQAREEGWLVVF
ncbi:MAG: DUF2278 family protein [Candidatus Thiothrix putei]|uniref:DUF2278 family protein n=1 Tax=Candidatus Thiothrix putei TaxID=3080811 RepID=A0AA95HG29_9GAMM|nr:MAG: DUF2278 family protein [Candidatus Thiothrix putei]